MSTQKKPAKKSAAKTAPNSKPKKRVYRSMKGLGFLGVQNQSVNKIVDEVGSPLAAIGSLVVVKMVNNKVKTMKFFQPETDGKGKWKKYLIPGVEVVGGAAGAYFGRKIPLLRNACIGVVVAGLDEGVAAINKSGKGLLGLGNANSDDNTYTESKAEMMKMIRQNSYLPALPAPAAYLEEQPSKVLEAATDVIF